LIRLTGYRPVVFDLEIFDRTPSVRSKNPVDLTGIDPQSLEAGLNRPDLIVAKLEIISPWRIWFLDEAISIQQILASR
jgi:hypothetical protein